MSKENDKIYFNNSPYENGHKVVDFIWNARLDENFKLVIDLHLESDQYDQEDEYIDIIEEIDDLSVENTEKSLWINYDHCIISSTFWNNKGIVIDTNSDKLSFDKLNHKTFFIDTLPIDINQPEENLSFGISMLGKDLIANHEITFIDTEEFGIFDVKWKAKVANTYLGEETFDYDFYVYMKNIKFGGIKIHPSLAITEVEQFFKDKLENFENFELVESDEFELEKYLFKLKNK